jgi:hypothetical protein
MLPAVLFNVDIDILSTSAIHQVSSQIPTSNILYYLPT